LADQRRPLDLERVPTGIHGLDNVLGGGLDPDRLYVVEGKPGTGKTTLALQFLLDGALKGEKGLYITLSETEAELQLVAARHGWSLDSVSIFQLVPPEARLSPSTRSNHASVASKMWSADSVGMIFAVRCARAISRTLPASARDRPNCI
jgi:circadian clock protein KaiC